MLQVDGLLALKTSFTDLAYKAKGVKESMDEFSEWNSVKKIVDNSRNIFNLITECVLLMEVAAKTLEQEQKDLVSGTEKREALVQFLDDMIKLPIYLEALDGPIIRILINLSVDKLNSYFGHDWGITKLSYYIQTGKDLLTSIGLIKETE